MNEAASAGGGAFGSIVATMPSRNMASQSFTTRRARPPTERPPTERECWEAFLASLTTAHGISVAQIERARSIWKRICELNPQAVLPIAGANDAGMFYLSWNYPPEGCLSVDIEPDGRLGWFFEDDKTGALDGNDGDLLDEPPPRFYTYARFFRRP